MKRKCVIFGSEYGEQPYLTVVGELPELGPKAILAANAFYGQIRHVNALRSRTQEYLEDLTLANIQVFPASYLTDVPQQQTAEQHLFHNPALRP